MSVKSHSFSNSVCNFLNIFIKFMLCLLLYLLLVLLLLLLLLLLLHCFPVKFIKCWSPPFSRVPFNYYNRVLLISLNNWILYNILVMLKLICFPFYFNPFHFQLLQFLLFLYTTVEQAVACTPVTQWARVRSSVRTSFLGEGFSGFFLSCKTNVRKL